MNLLEKIIASKEQEVEQRRREIPLDQLIQSSQFDLECRSLSKSIKSGTGIISEYKRKSPSAGEIQNRPLQQVLEYYGSHEISACSILTDAQNFGGKVEDLSESKQIVDVPILRKEFIINEYQVFEAKAYGADAILLIAEALDEYYAVHLATIANSIGLEVLMEFHSEAELNKMNEFVDVIGINNRNLSTLKTDVSNSLRLAKYLPYNTVKITESGISSAEQLKMLYNAGFDGCLIGESILKDEQLLPQLVKMAKQQKLVGYDA